MLRPVGLRGVKEVWKERERVKEKGVREEEEGKTRLSVTYEIK